MKFYKVENITLKIGIITYELWRATRIVNMIPAKKIELA